MTARVPGEHGPVRWPAGRPAARRGPVGERVRELRRGAGLTQHKLAVQLGYSVEMVRYVEQGRGPASAEFTRAVARLFGLRPRDVDPDAGTAATVAPAPHPDDAVTLLAEILAVLPDAVERLGAAHVEGPDRLCAACGGDQPWPCLPGWAVARAEWLARRRR